MSLLEPILLLSATAMLIILLAGWGYQYRTHNGGIADVLWAYCLAAAALLYAVTGSGSSDLRIVIALLAGFWYARLGTYLLFRVHSQTEDARYRAMREHWGRHAHAHFLWFFALQAALAWLFALPFWIIANNPTAFGVVHMLGVLLAAFAFAGESLADEQLRRFKQNPANRKKTCRAGLWRYSRHPNYFFEWLHWFAYPLLATGSAYAGWVWLAPLAMLVFLIFVTGIPYTEQQALRSKGDDYRDYQRTTSAFIPWIPKS